MKHKFLIAAVLLFAVSFSYAQDKYRYSVDLTKLNNDDLTVELLTPAIATNEAVFYMPKIVPGTYTNSDFGKFIRQIAAYDKNGKALPIKALPDSNGWQISKAKKLYKIVYQVEDSWDATFKHNVYEMAGTNFEEAKNFVLNTCGIFGYIDGLKKLPFELSFTKPSGFYASTGLVPASTSATTDVFVCNNADHLYDSPIMFCLPDTTMLKIGNTDVLVSVYAPKKMITSEYVAANLKNLLLATKDYLGGKLPVNKYAFIYYFNSEQPTVKGQGAWEHSYSSFYSLPEGPQKDMIGLIMDVSSHEFFHIVTPLNICSKEVREFDFNKTILSQHLWLYEGSTEYDAHHTQVTQGLIKPEEYLKRLTRKILISRKYYNDTLSFTELSLGSADVHAQQYGNVYQKGALISACLDIYLNTLSGGHYGLKNLKHDLSVRYGPENYFIDTELFDEITRLTFPEVRAFFTRYVQGNEALPYDEFFGYAGIKYIPKVETSTITLGSVSISPDGEGNAVISNTTRMNDFGKKMGYQKDDIILSINNETVTAANFSQVATKFTDTAKEGDILTVKVKRKDETVTLSAPAVRIPKIDEHILEFEKQPTAEQLTVRQAWLNTPCGN
ncbi:MAG TPA: peptidase M61 [Ferruginibacter sp.]|nr:peptidase M61 [Ferruginibacter sp.]HMP19780.1 peptidase M61 [Ferruginibacter sp.]